MPDPETPAPGPTDIEATPPKLRNPGLSSTAMADQPAIHVLQSGIPAGATNNYASNGHWDRDDLGPVAYVPPVEAHEDAGPVTDAAGHAPVQQGGPLPGRRRG